MSAIRPILVIQSVEKYFLLSFCNMRNEENGIMPFRDLYTCKQGLLMIENISKDDTLYHDNTNDLKWTHNYIYGTCLFWGTYSQGFWLMEILIFIEAFRIPKDSGINWGILYSRIRVNLNFVINWGILYWNSLLRHLTGNANTASLKKLVPN